ncbi:MAG: threonine--tRNA ligase, partial [candidate division WOR-3 bacterium]|nr:threonine--tRNA ligase [candidate division WOR-3 bacterium]
MQITINGNEYQIKDGRSVLDFLNEHKDVKQGMKYFALEIEGNSRDLTYMPSEGDDVELIDFESDMGRDIYRHSASHILAMAVKRLFPKTKLGIGPAIEDGFYYDFDTDEPFSDEQLKSIEKEMKKIIKEDIPFEREELSREEARELLKENNETYKMELLEDMEGNISVYKNNDFFDLCRGPHIPSTGYIKAVKLLHTAGAYWRGDEHNSMLSRIYGTAFSDKKSLKKYIHRIEEA